MCSDFPDWSNAAPGAEISLKIGYDYGRMVTGELRSEKEELDLLDEDKLSNEDVSDHQEETTMVSTSVGVLEELGLDATDLVGDETLSIFTSANQDSGMLN